MPTDYPLLLFPEPTAADRNKLNGRGNLPRLPGIGRQRQRVAPQLGVLQQVFEAKAVRLQQAAPVENPELVLVLEIAGTIEGFARAVNRIPGLEWLMEWAEEQIAPDDDFYDEDRQHNHTAFDGRLFLLASNQQALSQLLNLWNSYSANPAARFDRGLAPFRHLFAQLRTIRRWDVSDRVDVYVRQYWQECIDSGQPVVRFEIEAWYFTSAVKNEATRAELQTRVQELGGVILRSALIPEIAYHGFLVELPSAAIATILGGQMPELVLSDRVMFFRPKAQSITDASDDIQVTEQLAIPPAADGDPVVALLDGLPLSNHALLADRLLVDDPDNWEATYEAKDRVHGTAMASLILHGELDAQLAPLSRKLYVRPILRPDPSDFHQRRREHTPDDQLLIDLVHRSVRRICEGEEGEAPVAPTVRVVNLSVGVESRVFVREMSPWARLIDWLSYRYGVLFVVSAGNDSRILELPIPEHTISGMAAQERDTLALSVLTGESIDRRVISPAESINALSVGATHSDAATAPVVPGRFDLFAPGGVSPLSRIGHGYRRSVKPDILVPGGRVLYRERFGKPQSTQLEVVTSSSAPGPGHRVAMSPMPGGANNGTAYCRGTSNAAALTSRAATQAYDVIEALRATTPSAPPMKFDAVLLKAMLAHGASWGDWSAKLIAQRPEIQLIANGNARRAAEKEFVTRWLGFGMANFDRVLACTSERATLLGCGELGDGEALIFSAPLPPGLAGKVAWRRLTISLAWISPINSVHQGYRRGRCWVSPPNDQLRVKRANSVHERAAVRGTVQHEIFEGDDAIAFSDGDRFECKVNCAADAGELTEKVAFALCVSLEVAVGSDIAVYQEIRDRVSQPVVINAAAVV